MPFRDVIGHRHLTTLLQRAVARGSLPPTLLFAGPPGVGKWRVARALAAAVNCLAPIDGDACGQCRSCDRAARDVHVDIVPVEPDETVKIKIAAVRRALEKCDFRPFEGQRRAVLVRDADTLTDEAQTALLKSLEEPPPTTFFVLTSDAPDALLPTVRSRTMRLSFGRLPAGDLERLLVRDHAVAPDDARSLSLIAGGSVGAALALRAGTFADTRATAAELLRASGARVLAARLAIAKTVIGNRDADRLRQHVRAVLQFAGSLVRDVSVVHAGSDARLLANGDRPDDVQRLARTLSPQAARAAFATLNRALDAIDRNAGPKLVVEWVASEI